MIRVKISGARPNPIERSDNVERLINQDSSSIAFSEFISDLYEAGATIQDIEAEIAQALDGVLPEEG